MHFLKKLSENPEIEEPIEDNMDIHRHFYRYSRGTFIGPACKIRRTSTKISLKGSLEYEDIVEELVLKTYSGEELEVEGVLITGKDISDDIEDLGLSWELKESTGKTKNFKAKFSDSTVKKQNLLNAIEIFRENSYLLLTFNVDSACKVTTKKRLPRPSKKKPVDDDISKRVNFCKGYMENTEENSEMVINELIPDFIDELPEGWKKITLTNTYHIKDIEIPKNIKNSRMLRIMSIRKGKLVRNIDVDGDNIEKQYSIVV
ncbi:MAG: hypothetical protein GF317_03060 [Candidatus Lokiarchaeota archaeon]|nr:hypothetical protein [Candidatus Lokiarchaeota archaeon]MBD3198886.1 hypothetical protein [Candidatus Lokiarchaeota archaeon]